MHRAAGVRAGSIAALLERVGAFDRPERFVQLLTLCTCDFRAYPGRATRRYPKAHLLGVAMQACARIDESELTAHVDSADALLEARAVAIAAALRSERRSDPPDGGI